MLLFIRLHCWYFVDFFKQDVMNLSRVKNRSWARVLTLDLFGPNFVLFLHFCAFFDFIWCYYFIIYFFSMFCYLFIIMVEYLVDNSIESKLNIVESSDEFDLLLKLPLNWNQTLSKLMLIWNQMLIIKRTCLITMSQNLVITKLIWRNTFFYKVKDDMFNWVRQQ